MTLSKEVYAQYGGYGDHQNEIYFDELQMKYQDADFDKVLVNLTKNLKEE